MVLPGEGRVPYVPLSRRRPAYGKRIVVGREEGIVVPTSYGQQIKLVCQELTGDERFTVAERTYRSGAVAQVQQRDSEAIHILQGQGVFRAWPARVAEEFPIQVPLQPGMELVVDQGLRHEVRVTGETPLVALVTTCHLDFPAYPHHYPEVFPPGTSNTLHQHDSRVEAFYVVDGPGAISIADPTNHTVQDLPVPPGGAAYLPMYVLHRMFNPTPAPVPARPGDLALGEGAFGPATGANDCYWIHCMVVLTHRGSRLPQLHIRQHGLDGKAPIWPTRHRL